jgi:hypothetical protein
MRSIRYYKYKLLKIVVKFFRPLLPFVRRQSIHPTTLIDDMKESAPRAIHVFAMKSTRDQSFEEQRKGIE